MNKRSIGILIPAVVVAVVVVWFLLRPRTRSAEMSEMVSQQYGLKVGPALLGWSSRAYTPAQRDGYIYMRDVEPSGGNKPRWEFALSTKGQLSKVTREDLRCDFYGMDDPRGSSVFGDAWGGATILVPQGQIFFARLVGEPSIIYVICLAEQGGSPSGQGTMRIEYRVFNIKGSVLDIDP